MAELVSIFVGECGVQMGTDYFKLIAQEHQLNEEGVYVGEQDYQLENIKCLYEETQENYISRSIFCDLDPKTIETLKTNETMTNFRTENCISGNKTSNGNWATGHYTEGAEIVSNVQDSFRNEIERCDNLLGFQIFSSLGGGTGSGLGSLITSKVREEYPDKMLYNYTILPESKNQERNAASMNYNSVLTYHQLIENSDAVIMYNNDKLDLISREKLDLVYHYYT
eukprot:Anaeramoba_flamelloidesc26820_g1_i2.p1 GENE.c26820_g1_i2~~c26820_g1_i2.p1  ORF type:complete len:225 (-),score=48.38 c26820_g1_i2:635-1309(-)